MFIVQNVPQPETGEIIPATVDAQPLTPDELWLNYIRDDFIFEDISAGEALRLILESSP